MKKISIAFVAAMALASFGCKKKGAEAMGKMNKFRDDMCACKEKTCADKVNDEYTKWMQEMAKNASGNEKATATNEEDAKKMSDAATKLQECYNKLAGGGAEGGAMGSGAPEPAGGGSAAAPAGGEPAGGSAAPAAGGSAAAEPAGGSAAAPAGSAK